jgi:aspartate oxidase
MANGGMHWVSHPDDSPRSHFDDVVRIGCYLNDQNLVEALIEDAPQRAEELIGWGAKILMDGDKYFLIDPRGGGASHPKDHYIPGVTYMAVLRGRTDPARLSRSQECLPNWTYLFSGQPSDMKSLP